MTDTRPDPLVPADVDLRGLEYMPLLGGRLFESDFNLDANDAEFRVAIKLWWAAWNQVPAGSLPGEDHRIRKLAGLEEAPAKWRKVKEHSLHGFVECSDGRFYHPIIAQQALIAWEKRGEVREERANEAERQRRSRAERKKLFEQLRAVGVTPKWDISKPDLLALVTQHVTPPVTVTGHASGDPPVTPPVTRTDTAKTGRDGTGIEEKRRAQSVPPLSARSDEDSTTEALPTAAGLMCRAMRVAGLQAVNPGDPRLIALCAQGATEDEFVGIAKEAVSKGKGFAWVLTVLPARRAEASAIELVQTPKTDPNAWQSTRDGVINRGCALGMEAFDEVAAHARTGPSWPQYRAQVIAADAAQRNRETA